VALGEEGFWFLQTTDNILPRVPRTCTRGRGFFLKNETSSPSVELGEEFFYKKKQISSPSVALGEEDFQKKKGGRHRRRQFFSEC
jgi:hypothetical protein